MTQSRRIKSRFALQLLAAAGFGMSGWLLYMKATDRISYLVGCGSAGGCEDVLGSRWSQWFLIPVSALSLVLYLALFVLTFRPHRVSLRALAMCLIGAALWFGAVQAWILQAFCPYCLGVHLIGLACGMLIIFREREPGSRNPGTPAAFAAGSAAVLVLILGQIFGPVPATHLTTETEIPRPPISTDAARIPIHARGGGRIATFLVGKDYAIEHLPHLGSSSAPHVLVEYFDYSCNTCRDLHVDLEALLERYPGKFTIVVLPCPIDRGCNPHVPLEIANHAHACDLAKIALAAWRAEPAAFSAIHKALFTRPVLDQTAALAVANRHLTSPLTPASLEDPWIAEILAANAEDYRQISITNSGQLNTLMPKLMVGGTRMLHGVTHSREILFQALEQEFQLHEN